MKIQWQSNENLMKTNGIQLEFYWDPLDFPNQDPIKSNENPMTI